MDIFLIRVSPVKNTLQQDHNIVFLLFCKNNDRRRVKKVLSSIEVRTIRGESTVKLKLRMFSVDSSTKQFLCLCSEKPAL